MLLSTQCNVKVIVALLLLTSGLLLLGYHQNYHLVFFKGAWGWDGVEGENSDSQALEVGCEAGSEDGPICDYALCGNPNARKLIIYTRYRSGSSFTSEFFGQHPYVFFTFEPLIFLGQDPKWDLDGYLGRILNCSFTDILNELGKRQGESDMVDFWLRRVFCYDFYKKPAFEGNCYMEDMVASMQEICSGHPYVVTKIIRLSSLRSLVGLMKEGFKVLHLVRDPRGIINSRLQVEETKKKKACGLLLALFPSSR